MTTTAVAAPGLGQVQIGDVDRGRVLRRWLSGVHLLAFGYTCLSAGLPTDRLSVLLWVITGLAARCAGRGWRGGVRLLTDWVPLGAVLLCYDASRGIANTFGAPVHVTEPAAVDAAVFGVVPTVWLQASLTASGWWDVAVTMVYTSHFILTPVVLAVLWARNRALFGRYVRLVMALSLAGLVTYVLYPAAPPWLAAKQGVIGAVERRSNAGWDVLGLPRASALLESAQGAVNPVAAVPSLHTAFAVLVCLFVWPLARRRWQRLLAVGYAVAMAVVLVWSGEHYVVDTVLGAGYAAGVCALVPVLERLAGRGARLISSRAVVPVTVTPTTSSG